MARFRLKDNTASRCRVLSGSMWKRISRPRSGHERYFRSHFISTRSSRRTATTPVRLSSRPKLTRDIRGISSLQASPRGRQEPLDEEAIKLHEDYMERFGGRHPIEPLEATGMSFSDKMLEDIRFSTEDVARAR